MGDLFAPWRQPRRLVWALARIALGVPVSAMCFVIVFVIGLLSVTLTTVFLIGIPLAWVGLMAARGTGHVYRSMVAAFDDVEIADPVPPLTRPSWFGRLAERLRSKPRWREIAHALVAFPAHGIAYAVVVGAWALSSALALLPLYVAGLPGGSAKFGLFEIGPDAGRWIAMVIGVAGLMFAAPWATVAASQLLTALASGLLGPTSTERTAAEMQRLETSRSAAVDAAEAERRRIERDLHDGAQQRLVALAATLGSVKEQLERDPGNDAEAQAHLDIGREMVGTAHDEAKAALAEIRELVRGIHPVILEDRGLDAALSAVVARSPVPVSLDVQVVQRPPAAVESTAYFVVAETLTNVARHSNATRAHVAIARAADRLVVEVRDDGRGGADRTKGSGLQGLHDRVAGLGGSMYVISPEGGPTTITVELPCAS